MQVWDIFCRVVDNYGDAGVTWRLARQLAAEYAIAPRLWIDEPAALVRMRVALDPQAPVQVVEKVEVRRWTEGSVTAGDALADVVIEAFACELPEAYVRGMAARARKPLWLNLEYLSAEDWVEGVHGLASPQALVNPAPVQEEATAPFAPGAANSPRTGEGLSVPQAQAGPDAALVLALQAPMVLNKYFFFPGFTRKTGGLLRERGLLQVRAKFQADRAAQAVLWRALGVPPRAEAPAGELRISLFGYENPALPPLLAVWAAGPVPVRCLVPEGRVLPQVAAFFGAGNAQAGAHWTRGQLALHVLPFTDQPAYDRLLWACDLNFVRGEDSFVRAQWAGRPFVWQIYPQREAAHHQKLMAFWERYRAGLEPAAARSMAAAWLVWNGVAGVDGLAGGEGDGGAAAEAAAAVDPVTDPATDPAADWSGRWASLQAARPLLEAHAEDWASRLATQANLAAQLVEFAAKVPDIGV